MEHTPIFSIIIPIYKVEEYLSDCINSILQQTLKDYEVLLVDDESPDRCPIICEEYAKREKNIKVIHKKNGGLSDARNAGIIEAQGQYLLFCDSDDFWVDNNLLEKAYNCLCRYNCPDIILFSGRKFYENTGKTIYDQKLDVSIVNNQSKQDVLRYLVNSGTYSMSACTKIIKRKIVIDEEVYFTKSLLGEDLDWFIGVMQVVKSIKAVESFNYHYRIRNGSITQTVKQKNIVDFLWILNKWVPILLENEKDNVPLLAVLGYSYMTNLMYLMRLNEGERKQVFRKYKGYKFLLKYGKNKRVRIVYYISKILGIQITGKLLQVYYSKLIRK